MILPSNQTRTGQMPVSGSGMSGLGGWWSDISASVSDSIGKFSTAGATRIIAQPGTTVSTRAADGSSTTISRSSITNPTPSFGVDIPVVRDTSSSTILILAAIAGVVVMTMNRGR